MKFNYIHILLLKCKATFQLVFIFVIFSSCEEFVKVEPPKNQIIRETVFTDDATATGAVLGIYSQMISSSLTFASGGQASFTILGGLSADEFINYTANPQRSSFFSNSLLPTNSEVLSALWIPAYKYIYYANSVIEGLASTKNVTERTKKQLEGEAKFIRAFCYFYLVNLFGDVPLYVSTDYRANSNSLRASEDEIYGHIVKDLIDAQSFLSEDFSFSDGERVRPNKDAATALLARVYLFIGDWANANTTASKVIDNTSMFSLVTDLNKVFQKNSSEAIWQLMPVGAQTNTFEGLTFILTSVPTFVSLTNSLVNTFEVGDNRKTNWIGSYDMYSFPFKYKIKASGQPVTEYSMVLRLAEQYLIRAEARAEQSDIIGAKEDLNVIRNRAGLPNTTANDRTSLLQAIHHERQVELFAEWGHRWLDLKRTSQSDVVLSVLKGSNWQPTDILYPIPQIERDNNSKITQNNGY